MIKLIYTFIYLLRLPYKNIEYLNALRLDKLRKLIIHSKNNVAFYRKKFSNIELDRIKTVEDIRLLPIINPIELREEKIENITTNGLEQKKLLLHSTSGTLGMPFKLYVTREEDTLRQLKLIRCLYQHGWKPWWKGVHIWRETDHKSYSLFQRLINNRKYFVSIKSTFEEQAQQILNIKPQFIYAMTGSLELLATWMLQNNTSYKGVKFVLTGGAALTYDISEKFQKVFGHSGIDMYGAVETGLIGCQCPYCNLCYFDDDGSIVEILDENYYPVKPGKSGKAVITILDQFTTPIIRYDIGDYITIPKRDFNYKNKFTHYVSIDGRVADVLVLKDGRIIQYQHLAVINRVEGIKQFQFFQKSNGDLIIKYVRKSCIDKTEIEKNILEKMELTNNAEVSFEECDSIPLEPSGKFKRVKREIVNSI